MQKDKTIAIRQLNDQFRKTRAGGEIMLTQGIQALGQENVQKLLMQLRGYDDFKPDNDPYGEHDFGTLHVSGQKCFWKIDYYERTYTLHSPDPSDTAITHRVLTLMLAEEY